VRDATLGRVGRRAAEFLERDVLAGHGFDHLGTLMNMFEVPFAMMMKSVMAGLYTAPPAQGPRIALICGNDPDARDVPEEDLRRSHRG